MLVAGDVLDEARRRAAALADPYERACANEILAAAALAVLGPADAKVEAKGINSFVRLGRTAAELGVGAAELFTLLDRAGAEAKMQAGALAWACGELIDRGHLDDAATMLDPLRDLDAAAHELYAVTLARACLAAGDRAGSVAAVTRIKRSKGSSSSYIDLVDCACRAGDLVEARRLVPSIKDKTLRGVGSRIVALAAVRAGVKLDAEPLVAALDARDLAILLGELLAGWIADGRVDEAMTTFASHRTRLGEHVGWASRPIVEALAAHGSWDRAEAFVAEGDRDLDTHRGWVRALAAAGRDDTARAWIERTQLHLEPQLALGMTDRGDIDDALRFLANKTGVIPNAIEDAIDRRVHMSDPRTGVQWLARIAHEIRCFSGIPGRIMNVVIASGDPSLFDDVAILFAERPFGTDWLVALLEAGAWAALRADDPTRARVRLHAVMAHDPRRAQYIALAFGQLAAASIAHATVSTIAAVDELFSPLESPVHRAQAFAEAARALALRERGVVTALRQ